MRTFLMAGCLILFASSTAPAQGPVKFVEGTYVLKNFHFADGQTLPEVRMHYFTLGTPQRDARGVVRNAVLILHGTTGNATNFSNKIFAGELFHTGQPLDASRYYLILVDNIGHGQSSKPSDGLHARFPKYGYRDMIHAQHQLLTEGLQVNHLRLVMGTSMGGMHTWLWGEMYPDFMDALLPLASLPTQISGRNRIWRKMIIDGIRNDPVWQNGEYRRQPPTLRLAAEMMLFMSSNPTVRQREAPTLAAADKLMEHYVAAAVQRLDANDVLYALQASRDYDPAPGLDKIQAPLLAINFADDLINPPELGILEQAIRKVPHGKAIVMPQTPATRGHGTHTIAAVWKHHLAALLAASPPR
jgi:homoserine O-acetyltransferase